MSPGMSLYSVTAIIILAEDGSRLFAKYYTPPHQGAPAPGAAGAGMCPYGTPCSELLKIGSALNYYMRRCCPEAILHGCQGAEDVREGKPEQDREADVGYPLVRLTYRVLQEQERHVHHGCRECGRERGPVVQRPARAAGLAPSPVYVSGGFALSSSKKKGVSGTNKNNKTTVDRRTVSPEHRPARARNP